MSSTTFDLDQAVAAWRQDLELRQSLLSDDIAELELHLREQVDDLKGVGLSQHEAFLVARHRLGDTADIAVEFRKVKPWVSWRAPLFWILVAWLLIQTVDRLHSVLEAGFLALCEAAGWPMSVMYIGCATLCLLVPVATMALIWGVVTRTPLPPLSTRLVWLLVGITLIAFTGWLVLLPVLMQRTPVNVVEIYSDTQTMRLILAVIYIGFAGLALGKLRYGANSHPAHY